MALFTVAIILHKTNRWTNQITALLTQLPSDVWQAAKTIGKILSSAPTNYIDTDYNQMFYSLNYKYGLLIGTALAYMLFFIRKDTTARNILHVFSAGPSHSPCMYCVYYIYLYSASTGISQSEAYAYVPVYIISYACNLCAYTCV